MDLLMIGAFAIAALSAGWWWWEDRRHVPLAEFGMETVQRVLKFESDQRREEIWERGWLTRAEWRAINKRQLSAMDAELRRRGVR